MISNCISRSNGVSLKALEYHLGISTFKLELQKAIEEEQKLLRRVIVFPKCSAKDEINRGISQFKIVQLKQYVKSRKYLLFKTSTETQKKKISIGKISH